MPAKQIALLEQVAAANQNVMVVLSNGSVVSVAPWAKNAKGILESCLLGQAGGPALADVIFGQEVGSKANSIAVMLACGYESRKVMMVGDAMGDAQAAAANGVAFVPILPGREAESWRRLQEEALPKLLHGTFNPTYQNELLAALRSALHG